MEYGRNTAKFLSETLGIKQQLRSFYDIRSNPTISLSTILCAIFLMPFFGLKSLLALDTLARSSSYKKLFDCKRKMVVSDSTIARVLRWTIPDQFAEFLLSFVSHFDQLGLLEKALEQWGNAAVFKLAPHQKIETASSAILSILIGD